MNIQDIELQYDQDFHSVEKWNQDHYENVFSSYFSSVKSLASRLSSSFNPITDKELEEILSIVPLELFAVSEKLNDVKSRVEVIKLNIKQKKRDQLQVSEATSQAGRQADANASVIEDELLLHLYTSLIERVENEISASKELIMSAKKIWTSRREAENIANAAENTNLPDYSDMDSSKQSYIK